MDEHSHLPDTDRLSILTAIILLAYALIPFIKIAPLQLALNLPQAVFTFNITFSSMVGLLVALLAAAGTYWLLQSHPHLGNQRTLPHWLIPAMTALVLVVPLSTITPGLQWWGVFAFSGVLLVFVFIGEYIEVDPADIRHVPASIGLTAVSFALYLVLAIAVRGAGLRLYLILLALTPTAGLIVLRALYLRLGARWYWGWAAGIGILVGQVALGLYYLPITPVRFGLMLTGLGYALTSLAGNLEEGGMRSTAWLEPAVMLGVIWLAAFLLPV